MMVITITIIDTYPLKLKLLEINIDNKLQFAHELSININQKLF